MYVKFLFDIVLLVFDSGVKCYVCEMLFLAFAFATASSGDKVYSYLGEFLFRFDCCLFLMVDEELNVCVCVLEVLGMLILVEGGKEVMGLYVENVM